MSHNFKAVKPLRANGMPLQLSTTFKARGQDGRMKRIARGIPDQATLDYFLSRVNPAGRAMALELLRPHLDFRPTSSEPEQATSAPSAGPADSTSGEVNE